jgi:RsiW-degrading membrane proteinase PrsW (M82 family)
MTLAVGLVFVLLGIGISSFNASRQGAYESMFYSGGSADEVLDGASEFEQDVSSLFTSAIAEVLNAKDPFHEKLQRLNLLFLYAMEPPAWDLPARDAVDQLTDDEFNVATAYLVEASSSLKEEGGLKQLADAELPPAYANYAWSLTLSGTNQVDALKREIEFHSSDPIREELVLTYMRQKDYAALEVLAVDPEYDSLITPYIKREIALDQMDWPMLIKMQIPASYEYTDVAMVLLALVSGAIWLMVLLRFNEDLSWRSPCVLLALPALILGALSAHATILVIFAQEHYLNFTEGSSDLSSFMYCVFGIGLREEGLKLLFFVPLLPFVRKMDDLQILTIAGMVGLGFAIEENINYFERSEGISALGRFVTANFLHISLTAACGLSLARAVIYRGREIQQAATIFALAVIAHGLYDAFLIVPLLLDYSIFSSTVFVLIGYQYFNWLSHMRNRWQDRISITSTFILGTVVLTGISFCLYAWNVGAAFAFQAIGYEVIGVAIIMIMFVREIPETLR